MSVNVSLFCHWWLGRPLWHSHVSCVNLTGGLEGHCGIATFRLSISVVAWQAIMALPRFVRLSQWWLGRPLWHCHVWSVNLTGGLAGHCGIATFCASISVVVRQATPFLQLGLLQSTAFKSKGVWRQAQQLSRKGSRALSVNRELMVTSTDCQLPQDATQGCSGEWLRQP